MTLTLFSRSEEHLEYQDLINKILYHETIDGFKINSVICITGMGKYLIRYNLVTLTLFSRSLRNLDCTN